MKIWLETK